jgi:hypothetical protein
MQLLIAKNGQRMERKYWKFTWRTTKRATSTNHATMESMGTLDIIITITAIMGTMDQLMISELQTTERKQAEGNHQDRWGTFLVLPVPGS